MQAYKADQGTMIEGRMFIGGKWVRHSGHKTQDIRNPATGEVIGTVPVATAEDVDEAIDSAWKAFPAWKETPAVQRGERLYRVFELMLENRENLARLLTREQGKPYAEALGEISAAAEFVRWYSEEGKRVYGETIPASAKNRRIIVLKQPVGVVAAITPWNFPMSMVTRKMAPALAAGCTVVLKPAQATPLCAVALMELFSEAGFPPGVVNLVTGSGGTIGQLFIRNKKVRKITFTGSTEVGKELLRGAADQVKRVSLELGGHAPFIVFADADLEAASEAAIANKFRNAGQTCICTNRFLVEESVLEPFAKLMAEKASSLKVGNGLDPDVQVGPLINAAALEKVEEHVADAVGRGARVIAGGHRIELPSSEKGNFYAPTVLTDVTEDMKICREETFGPVAPLLSFRSDEEAIEKANAVSYGLASYVFTNDLSRTFHVLEALEYGIVGINDPNPAVAQAPFGGWKESGLGREGGHYGIEAFLEVKYASIGLISHSS